MPLDKSICKFCQNSYFQLSVGDYLEGLWEASDESAWNNNVCACPARFCIEIKNPDVNRQASEAVEKLVQGGEDQSKAKAKIVFALSKILVTGDVPAFCWFKTAQLQKIEDDFDGPSDDGLEAVG